MLAKTQGIILKYIKYGDSSRIIHIYTKNYGRLPFMVKGLRKKSGFSQALFQPLTLLDLEIYYKAARNLQQVREARMSPPLLNLYGDIQKTGMALFLSELLVKTIPEEEANPDLFDYLYHAIRYLDEKENISNHFHLFFVVRLTRFLGISPLNDFSAANPFLDMREGLFVSSIPTHEDYLDKEEAAFFSSLMNTSVEHLDVLPKFHQGRKYFLEKLLLYYRIHLDGMGKIKSLEILHDVFH